MLSKVLTGAAKVARAEVPQALKGAAVKLGNQDAPPQPASPAPEESFKPPPPELSRRASLPAAFRGGNARRERSASAFGSGSFSAARGPNLPFGVRGFHSSAPKQSNVYQHYEGQAGSLLDIGKVRERAHQFSAPNPAYRSAFDLVKKNKAQGAIVEFGACMGETFGQISGEFPQSKIIAIEQNKAQADAMAEGLKKRPKLQQDNVSVQNASNLNAMGTGSAALVLNSRVLPYLDQAALTEHGKNLDRVLVPGGVAHFNFYHATSTEQFVEHLKNSGTAPNPVMTASGMMSALGVGPGQPLQLHSVAVHVEITHATGEKAVVFPKVEIPAAELAEMSADEVDQFIASVAWDHVANNVEQMSVNSQTLPHKLEVRPEIVVQKPLASLPSPVAMHV